MNKRDQVLDMMTEAEEFAMRIVRIVSEDTTRDFAIPALGVAVALAICIVGLEIASEEDALERTLELVRSRVRIERANEPEHFSHQEKKREI